jgi:hypothetical protein
MSRIPENLFAISEPALSQLYRFEEILSIQITPGASIPFFHRRICPLFLQVLVLSQILVDICVRVEPQ